MRVWNDNVPVALVSPLEAAASLLPTSWWEGVAVPVPVRPSDAETVARRVLPSLCVILVGIDSSDARATLSSVRAGVDHRVPSLAVLCAPTPKLVQALTEAGVTARLDARGLTAETFRSQVRSLLDLARNGTTVVLRHGAVTLDRRARSVAVRGVAAHLYPAAYRMLERLMVRAGETVPFQDLYESHHGTGTFAEAYRHRVVQTISDLRRSLGPESSRIQSVRGQGYLFAAGET